MSRALRKTPKVRITNGRVAVYFQPSHAVFTTFQLAAVSVDGMFAVASAGPALEEIVWLQLKATCPQSHPHT